MIAAVRASPSSPAPASRGPGGARTGRPDWKPWKTRLHRCRRWHRVREPGGPETGEGQRRGVVPHRPRKAAAERLRRTVQRKPARRRPERGNLRQPGRCPSQIGGVAIRLEPRHAALLAGWTAPPLNRARRLSKLKAPCPARFPSPKPTTTNPKDPHEGGTIRWGRSKPFDLSGTGAVRACGHPGKDDWLDAVRPGIGHEPKRCLRTARRQIARRVPDCRDPTDDTSPVARDAQAQPRGLPFQVSSQARNRPQTPRALSAA